MRLILQSKALRFFLFVAIAIASACSSNLQAQNLTVNIVDSMLTACQDDAFASVNIAGGTAPYSVYWIRYIQSPAGPNGGPDTVATGASVTGLAPGYYNVHVYDSNSPTAVFGSTGVYVNPAFSIFSNNVPATCSNADGKLRISIQNAPGPYDIVWSTGDVHNGLVNPSDSIMNVAAGWYSAIVTSSNGCFVNAGGGAGTSGEGLYVYSTSPITATTAATPSNCFDGTATVTPANGTAPYTYVWNTIPAQFTQTASGLSPGYIICTISDASGCSRQQYVNVPAGPNYLQVTSAVTPAVCLQSNGAINMTVTGGVSPYTYTWSNGSTSEDQTGLAAGSYQVQITDNLGCSLNVYKYISTSSPVNANVSASYSGCLPSGGSASVSVSGGVAPYAYSWNNGATTSSLSGLEPGYYHVQVTDANGCTDQDYDHAVLPASCYVHIYGKVFNDLNGNCAQDPGEGALSNVLVNASPGYHYATTDGNGNYHISVAPGAYDIEVFAPNQWTQICPDSPQSIHVNATSAGTAMNNNNFYLQPDSIFSDVSVYLSSGPARPGFPVHWYANIRNLGTTSVSPLLSVQHDALTTYSSASPAVATYSAATNTATWTINPLAPQASRSYYLYSTLSTSAVLGDSIHGTATVSLAGTDANLENNTYEYARLISGSYDPNDKSVSPKGLGDQGYITYSDTAFHYQVRFQNTGTDTAFTVVIRDTLDPSLDVPSFRLDQTSHPVEYTITGEGYITFTFSNILLPDSFINEPRSHGLISYNINRKLDIPLGTQIKNTASIYFDFNLPIVTNTTVNTLFDPTVGISNPATMGFSLMPNPAQQTSRVVLQLQEHSDVSYSVLDLSGRLVIGRTLGYLSAGEHQWELAGLPSGVYFVKIRAGNYEKTEKLVISK
jgi:uncharacterized repeat protein (TIGR01451 family)